MMKQNIHKYETDVTKISKNCILCSGKITNEEVEYEDYYIIFRGFTSNSVKGFACFRCISEEKGNCPYCNKRLAHIGIGNSNAKSR